MRERKRKKERERERDRERGRDIEFHIRGLLLLTLKSPPWLPTDFYPLKFLEISEYSIVYPF
jgi:hypothetical protein